jgi:protein TonB
VATDRRALPPLEVEVVAGDTRQNVRAKNNSVQVDMYARGAAPPAGAGGVTSENSEPTNAAERVKMSATATQALERPVNPSYPVLARQMKVQGSVVLQAWIAKDGLIQDLKVVSGPAILSSAAREAVRQWRFKPYLQDGQPVETEAKITVNFTISTL